MNQARMGSRKEPMRYWTSGGTTGRSGVAARSMGGTMGIPTAFLSLEWIQHPYHATGWRLAHLCQIITRSSPMGFGKILRVASGCDGADGHDEPQTICAGNLAATPLPHQPDSALGIDEPRVCTSEGFGPNIVLLHPTKAFARQRRDARIDQRCESDIT